MSADPSSTYQATPLRRIEHTYFPSDDQAVLNAIAPEQLVHALTQMMLIRHFETRAEGAYLQGKIGGFFHSYAGQEAIQTAVTEVFGSQHWYATSYRCHALALLLGASPRELMAELYGRATGNAKGRGGSMHLYTERLLGGFGIVGGQIPIATGAAFTSKYLSKKEELSLCFLGDGAVAQGAFHESLNLAALWDLPCIYIIENNQWGMGTAINRAISVEKLAEDKAASYKMKGYTLDGNNFFNCYAGFKHIYREVLEKQRPVLVEVYGERFRGHSVSDPGLYRSKEDLKDCLQKDAIISLQQALLAANIITPQQIKVIEEEQRQLVVDAMKFADESPWPEWVTLEEDVYAP